MANVLKVSFWCSQRLVWCTYHVFRLIIILQGLKDWKHFLNGVMTCKYDYVDVRLLGYLLFQIYVSCIYDSISKSDYKRILSFEIISFLLSGMAGHGLCMPLYIA